MEIFMDWSSLFWKLVPKRPLERGQKQMKDTLFELLVLLGRLSELLNGFCFPVSYKMLFDTALAEYRIENHQKLISNSSKSLKMIFVGVLQTKTFCKAIYFRYTVKLYTIHPCVRFHCNSAYASKLKCKIF